MRERIANARTFIIITVPETLSMWRGGAGAGKSRASCTGTENCTVVAICWPGAHMRDDSSLIAQS